MTAPDATRSWTPIVIAVVVFVFVLGAAACTLVRPEPMSVAAPFLGPWAGLVYGHSDCTMASALPEISWAVVAFGVLALGLNAIATRAGTQIVGLVLATLWAFAWCGLAAMSVLNTTS